MKIMVWNIEKFTDLKFQNYSYKEKIGGLLRKRNKPNFDREWYMEHVFNVFVDPPAPPPPQVPDVIAVLETMCDDMTAMGAPMPPAKSAGVTNMLNHIKAWTGNPLWRVVPPLKCNPPGSPAAEEAVAVYYNSATVAFEGPEYRGGVAPGIAYPAPWNAAAISGGTTRAGTVNHVNGAGIAINFPAPGNRSPFLVDLREIGGAARLIRCLFMHTSPQHGVGGSHVTGTAAIANIQAMIPPPLPAPLGTPDFYVACGDFNVNEYSIHQSNAAYHGLTAIGYTKMLTTGNTDATHYIRKRNANPLNNPFGYMQHEIIDNFLVRQTYGGPPPAYVREVINCVDGIPVPWATAMNQDLATIQGLPTGPGLYGPTATFRQWQNFWCIAATSDHAPIYLQIP